MTLKYISDYEDLGFGMFIHWGLYSQLRSGEWVSFLGDVDRDEYNKLKETFTAADFDARGIARFARETGMKYITLTTRHHDGFSLYDTRGLNDFDAPHSAAARDLVKEFVDGCNAEGIVPFFYHAVYDWYNKDYEGNFNAYLSYLQRSIEILCTNYGKVGGFFFDGLWDKPDADWKETQLYAIIRKHQPEAIIINNTGLTQLGAKGHPEIDCVTFERGRPKGLINNDSGEKHLAGEMCETLNSHWGICGSDINYKSPRELIESLCLCRRHRVNFLLNIGPTAQGGIDAYQRELLKLIGRWTKENGEAIYRPKPYSAKTTNTQDFVLRDGGKLYFFIHNLEVSIDEHVTKSGIGEGLKGFRGVTHKVRSIKWLDSGETLDFMQDIERGHFVFNATDYHYGENLIVRVAVAEII